MLKRLGLRDELGAIVSREVWKMLRTKGIGDAILPMFGEMRRSKGRGVLRAGLNKKSRRRVAQECYLVKYYYSKVLIRTGCVLAKKRDLPLKTAKGRSTRDRSRLKDAPPATVV